MSKGDMVREAVQEAKAKAAMEAEADKSKAEIGDEAEQGEEKAPPREDDVKAAQEEPGKAEEAKEAEEPEETKESEEPEETEEAEEAGKSPDILLKGHKRFGIKIKKDKKDEKIEELTDKLMRQMAEFDNFRKRTEKEKAAMYDIGARDVIEKILPVVDNFERGLASVTEEESDNPFAQGMEKIYKQFMTTLEAIGVKPIEAVGNGFDPNLHNAVMHEENEEYGENVVTAEFQKGYTYHDSVVRHSMVKVAN